jgi:hypothetical protein
MNPMLRSAPVMVVYLTLCAAMGYLFGDLADAGWAVLIGAIAPYALFYAVTLFGLALGAEPSRTQRRRPRPVAKQQRKAR